MAPVREDEDDDLPVVAPPNPKLQRWVDLLASLLARRHAVTFEELVHDVPEYWIKFTEAERASDDVTKRKLKDSLKRTFERDKDELRAFGVPLESEDDEDGATNGAYRIERKDFYLPYLCFAAPGGDVVQPRKSDKYGYQSLTSLTFEADELQAVVDAAAGVRGLGDPLLAADVDSALRKLAVDLPVDAARASADEPRVVLSRARPDAATFELLGDALRRRKSVAFSYHAMSTDRTEEREVEPYGLFFLSGNWYLAARDRGRGELSNFRLNRMGKVKVNALKAQSADYEVPATFRLREHARSRHTWELGDGDATPVEVEFHGESGATMAAMRLGRAVEGSPNRRAFDVRRRDAFVRWLLSFAGELRPVGPPDVVDMYRREVEATAAVYSYGAPPAPASTATLPARGTAKPDESAVPSGDAWQPKGAAAQLRRILHLVPQIADGEEHSLADVAARIGTTAEVLQRDLYSLVTRYDAPAGFVDGVQLYVEPDRVSAVSNHLMRPMRLTVPELCALELGLAVLRAHRPPDEYAALDRARERLRAVITRLPADSIPDGLYGASLGEHGNTAHLAVVKEGLQQQRKVRLVYRRSGSATPGERILCPYALVASNGMLYIVGYCEREQEIRVFRMDRVEDATLLGERFERPSTFSVDEVLQRGKVFNHAGSESMRVRYSPRIARWIAEREGKALAADGSLEMEHPVADGEWAMRHVLQYGRDAEVLAPAALRERLLDRLRLMGR